MRNPCHYQNYDQTTIRARVGHVDTDAASGGGKGGGRKGPGRGSERPRIKKRSGFCSLLNFRNVAPTVSFFSSMLRTFQRLVSDYMHLISEVALRG